MTLKTEYIVKVAIAILVLGGLFYLQGSGSISEETFKGIIIVLCPALLGWLEYNRTKKAIKDE